MELVRGSAVLLGSIGALELAACWPTANLAHRRPSMDFATRVSGRARTRIGTTGSHINQQVGLCGVQSSSPTRTLMT